MGKALRFKTPITASAALAACACVSRLPRFRAQTRRRGKAILSSHHDSGLKRALSTDEALWLLGSLAGYHRKPFDAELLTRRFPPPWDLSSLIEALAVLGMHARAGPWPAAAHPEPPLPAAGFMRAESPHNPGQPLLLASREDGQISLFKPGEAPRELNNLLELTDEAEPWLLLCSAQPDLVHTEPDADTPTPDGPAGSRAKSKNSQRAFGFSWFIPELLRHRNLWRDVLLASLAEGKLVPQEYLKIVQPSEAGIVSEILVREGQRVQKDQVLLRMDALTTEADLTALTTERWRQRLAFRRLDADLQGQAMEAQADDPPALLQEAIARQRANQAALNTALAEERSRMLKAQQELAAAEQQRERLQSVVPHYVAQETAYAQLADQGFTGQLMVSDKRRERIEKEQELATQKHVIASARAGIDQSAKKLDQIQAEHRQRLHSERAEVQTQLERLEADWRKQHHRRQLMELRAPHEGIVKELATHTVGTVVQPGTVLTTLVPQEVPLKVEVWISNDDIGFVRAGQAVKLKLAAYPFQKYGMASGEVQWVNADAQSDEAQRPAAANGALPPPRYKALVNMAPGGLVRDGERYTLSAGMQVQAEILLGQRTVMQYLLSPIQRAWHEAARER